LNVRGGYTRERRDQTVSLEICAQAVPTVNITTGQR
jgi:hypothetical protein